MSDCPIQPQRASRWQHLAALALYCALTVVMVYPLVANISTVTVGWEGDNMYCIRLFWWAKHAIVDRAASPFWDPSAFYPVGHEVASGEMSAANAFLGIPFTVLWGPLVAYNLTLLITFVMTGFGTYLWIRWLTGSFVGGLVAGVIAAFLPFRFAHLVGHLMIVSTHWVPFVLYSFDRFLDGKKTRHAVALGATTAMVALCSWYFAYSIALILPIYAMVRSRPWRVHWNREWWRGVAVAAVVTAAMVLPFVIPYMQARSHHNLVRGIAEMEFWSLNFYDFWLPNSFNPTFNPFMLRWFPIEATQWVDRGVTVGYTAFGLALIALFARKRHPAILGMLAVWAASYLIALGPTLHSGDRPILVPMPLPLVALAAKVLSYSPSLANVRADILAHQAFAVPMPSLFLYAFVPMTNGMRVMARFGMWTGIMTAGLAGWGTFLLQQRLQRRWGASPFVPVILVGVLSSLVLFESRSELIIIPMKPRAVDVWLAQQPKDAAVIDLPLEQAVRYLQNYYKTVHEQPTVFGRIGDAFEPEISKQRSEVLKEFPSERSLAALREWRVRYVMLTPALIPDWLNYEQKLQPLTGLRFDREIEGVRVYLIH